MVGTRSASSTAWRALGYLATANGSELEAYAERRFPREAIDETMWRFFDGAVDVEEPKAFIPGLGASSYRKLIAAGVLETAEEFSPEARRVIPVATRASGEAFKERYVTLGELCQRTGLHHKQVRQRLREAGVGEAFPYEVVGTFFYERQASEVLKPKVA